MKRMIASLFILLSIIMATGCAYRYYMGMHGPTVKGLMDIHGGMTEDKQCLGCHDPQGNPQGPATSHPRFKGCLKCHNDELK